MNHTENKMVLNGCLKYRKMSPPSWMDIT